MAPTVMRLLGARWPNTVAGTIAGNPPARPALAATTAPADSRNRRRVGRSTRSLAMPASGMDGCYTKRVRDADLQSAQFGESPQAADERITGTGGRGACEIVEHHVPVIG